MEAEPIDDLLFSPSILHREGGDEKDLDQYLEQYRIYLHVFNAIGDRRQKSNEFFLGLNTAIIGILGYIETKSIPLGESLIFLLVPFVGIAICICWYQFIESYRQLNRAKFKVIHRLEKKLPIALFESEWELLGKGQDTNKYRKLSSIEKKIPIIFILLYVTIFLVNIPWDAIHTL